MKHNPSPSTVRSAAAVPCVTAFNMSNVQLRNRTDINNSWSSACRRLRVRTAEEWGPRKRDYTTHMVDTWSPDFPDFVWQPVWSVSTYYLMLDIEELWTCSLVANKTWKTLETGSVTYLCIVIFVPHVIYCACSSTHAEATQRKQCQHWHVRKMPTGSCQADAPGTRQKQKPCSWYNTHTTQCNLSRLQQVLI